MTPFAGGRAPLRRLRPWLLAATAYSALACALLWPLLRSAATTVTQPGDDPLLNSWILWWNLQALPLTDAWWNAPSFYPARGAMAYSETLLGEVPLAAPVLWLTGHPALAHNVAVILSFPLCALAAHALAYQLTGRHTAAALAGLGFGFGAFRANHVGHLQILSYYWAPIALLCLHRALAAPRAARWFAGAAAACVMQVLCNGYALFQLPVLLAAWSLWFPRTWRQRAGAVTSLAVALLALVPLLLGYRAVHRHFGFVRSGEGIRALSNDILALVQVNPSNVLLGGVIPGPQTSWFPGVTVIVLLLVGAAVAFRHRVRLPPASGRFRHVLLGIAAAAAAAAVSVPLAGAWRLGPLTVTHPHKPLSVAIVAAGVWLATSPRARRLWRSRSPVGFYALAAAVFFVLSLGPLPRFAGTPVFYQAPYALLMRLPGYDSIRAPDRMALLGSLGLVLVVALTYVRWADAVRWQRAVWLALCAGLVADGWFGIGVQPVPVPGPAPTAQWRDVGAVVELPFLLENDVPAMYRSIRYGAPSVNGGSGYAPQHYYLLRDELARGNIEVLHGLDVPRAVAVVIARASPEHDREVRVVAAQPGATLAQQTPEWTVYRMPTGAAPPPADGGPLPIARTVPPPAGMADSTVVVELAGEMRLSSVRVHVGVWPVMPRAVAVETSLDGFTWSPGWEGGTPAAIARALLRDPLAVSFVLPLEPRQARFVRLTQRAAEEGRTLRDARATLR
jgi:hypothetical protein